MVVAAERLISEALAEDLAHYRGQWVAISDDAVVAAADTPGELFAKMDALGEHDATVHHVPEDPQAVFIL